MDNEFPVEALHASNAPTPPPLPPRRNPPSNVFSQTEDTNMSAPTPPPLPTRKIPAGLAQTDDTNTSAPTLIPPPLPPRRVPGGLTQTDDSPLLSNLDDVEENGLNERQLRELYDNEEIDRFLTLFSDVCNTSCVFRHH